MGAKSPVKLRLRRAMFKCNICHRKMISAQALKTHQYSFHKIGSATSSKAPVKNVKAKPMSKKAPAAISKVFIPVDKAQSSMHASDNSDDEASVFAQKVSDLRKVQFECPHCNSIFPAYFSAFKHIQKNHCINSKGQKVDPDSVELIKPLRVEICIKCNKRVRANDMHMCCETGPLDQSMECVDYMCMGCKQKFASMQLFDLHVSGLHSQGVESLFFPNMNEFLQWKTEMQLSTKTTYLILGKCNLKQTFRCTYLPPAETTGSPNSWTSHICPASIVVQEFTKGIQVHFYRVHHGHKCPEYVCPDRFKKYLITSLMQQKNVESYDVDFNEKDLYCQFKVLLESIIIEAAKVRVDDLKLLIEKALEMTSILNNYDEDDDSFSHSTRKSICEEQITKALESLNGVPKKRKRSNEQSINIDQKKKKEQDVTPKIVNTYSMASNNDKQKEVAQKKQESAKKQEVKKEDVNGPSPKEVTQKKQESAKKQEVKKDVNVPSPREVEKKKQESAKKQEVKKEDVNVPSPRVLRNTQIQSPSFNDSYKEFVDQNFKGVKQTGKASKTPNVNKSNVAAQKPLATPPQEGLRVRPLSKLIDSKIEELLAKDETPVPSPVKNVIETKDSKGSKSDSSDVAVRRIPPKENKGPNSDPKGPVKGAKSAKSEEAKEAKDAATHKQFPPKIKTKKQVMKTKMGQFKPSLSPKSLSPKSPSPKSLFPKSPSPKKTEAKLIKSIGKVKDVEYEVMEQENDCNILILKI